MHFALLEFNSSFRSLKDGCTEHRGFKPPGHQRGLLQVSIPSTLWCGKQQLASKAHSHYARRKRACRLKFYSDDTFFCHSVLSGIETRQWQVSDIEAQNRSIKKGMKGPVFHQFNIPNISPSQADSTHLPKTTYGIQLKGSSFSKTVSFSLNFLRRSV